MDQVTKQVDSCACIAAHQVHPQVLQGLRIRQGHRSAHQHTQPLVGRLGAQTRHQLPKGRELATGADRQAYRIEPVAAQVGQHVVDVVRREQLHRPATAAEKLAQHERSHGVLRLRLCGQQHTQAAGLIATGGTEFVAQAVQQALQIQDLEVVEPGVALCLLLEVMVDLVLS
mgnify:CR=1 FL=1